ncbi:hypothetical protein SCOCK_70143 [Actinacidiphila cocklensis]|uniref:Uncharacterized protein n=1 Tax=Actinacidiphila cocklensis TaxID=887465 RepID=A0A9W4GUR7_9ACTN|nr:hypothetical protein SCOCK_70143 [Actinacidiphila cocklensis]
MEPHCRTSRCARPQPDAFTEEHPSLHCWYCKLRLRYCRRRPLITAGHPVRRQLRHRPAVTWLRNSTAVPTCTCVYCCPAVRVCRAPLDLDYDRKHTHAAAQCLLQAT